MRTIAPENEDVSLGLTAADAVWIATATLHEQNPKAAGFSPASIRDEVLRQRLTSATSDTIYQHAIQHLVATLPANPNKRRMLSDAGDGLRRLYVPGDAFHPSKSGRPFEPRAQDLPPQLRGWLLWYDKWSHSHGRHEATTEDADPLLALVGTGTHLYQNEHADEFLAHLRSNWGGVA